MRVIRGGDERRCPSHAYELGRRHERNVYLEERRSYLARIANLEANIKRLLEVNNVLLDANMNSLRDMLRVAQDVREGSK
jgi:hypothetical protein